jgi:signal transduction histidine kinase
VIATDEHSRAFSEQLGAVDIDVAVACRRGQLRFLEARTTLSEFMVGGMPDAELFSKCLKRVLEDLFAEHPGVPVRAYGEMVDVLWQAGHRDAAQRLEELWNELHASHSFTLLCGYRVSAPGVQNICAAHSLVRGPASTVGNAPEQGGAAASASHARALVGEAAHGKTTPALRASLRSPPYQAELEAAQLATSRRNERLMKVTAAMAAAVARDQVLDAVVNQVAMALEASSAGLWLVSEDGATAKLVRSVGYSPAARQNMQTLPLASAAGLPVLDAILHSAPVWLSSQAELILAYPHLAGVVTPGRSYSIACAPLVVLGHTRGAVAFTFDDGRTLDKDERDFILLVARYSGQAIERLRMLDAERSLRAAAEVAATRLVVLGRASRVFAEASPNLEKLFRAITRQVTLEYADASSVALISPAGDQLEVVAVQHRDPDVGALIQNVLQAAPLRVGEGVTGQVALTGTPVRVPAPGAAAAFSSALPAERLWLEPHVPHSLVVVPLCASGRVIGTLTALREDGSNAFSADDQQLLEELANRAALAIESGRLYQANAQARLRAELLYELAAAVIGAIGIEDVFDAALDGIEHALGANRCAVLAFDTEGVMRFRAWRGLSAEYRDAVEGHSPWPRDVRAPEPIVVRDVYSDPGLLGYSALFRRERIGALGFVPLVAAGQLIGKFMVYYEQPRTLSPSEIDMAKAIANHVAAAMNRFASVAELEQTVRFNEMFTGMLGHDLRNPLGAIMTAAQIALRRGPGEQLVRPLSRILGSGERMARMIDQLLDFTRVRVGAGIPINPAPSDLVPILQQVIDELEGAIVRPAVRLEPASGDTTGSWDSDRISQVFSNLVANALQHGTPEHSVRVRIDGSRANLVRVEVHNQGEVPSGLLARMFEPMAGGDRRGDKSRGLGLGLYISQQIIKAHGGSIHAQTSVEGGTTFSVQLPRGTRSVAGS